jgi:CBS-domain-containing membrane protein
MEAAKNSDEIKVADWMTETVLTVEIYDSISVARQLMSKHRVNQLPVLDRDRLMGIVTDRDIRDAYPTSMLIGRAKEIDKFAESYTVEEVMTHDVFTVEPETPLATAVALLRHHRIGSLPVVKEKQLVGIITRSDILDFVLSGAGIKVAAKSQKARKKLPAAKKVKRSKTAGRRSNKVL